MWEPISEGWLTADRQSADGSVVSGDPDDNRFPECADAARADYLVTGNLRHFPQYRKKIKMITPREFIGLVAPHLIT
jgi:uncharacterized protein